MYFAEMAGRPLIYRCAYTKYKNKNYDNFIPQRSHFCSVSVKRQISPMGKHKIAVIIPHMPYFVVGW